MDGFYSVGTQSREGREYESNVRILGFPDILSGVLILS